MKKTTPYLIGLCLVLLGLLIYSCSKRYEDPATINSPDVSVVPDDMLKAAQDWHKQQTLSANEVAVLSNNKKSYVLPPNWKEARMLKGNDGKSKIIVAGPDAGVDPAYGRGVVRNFVFTEDNGNVTDGKIIEIFSSRDSIERAKGTLMANYLQGKMTGFTGAVISYDVNYKSIKSEVYTNGVINNKRIAKVYSMKISSFAKLFGTQAAKGKIDASGKQNPINTLINPDCTYLIYGTYQWFDDWGWVLIDYQILAEYCGPNNNETGGGGGGGGGSGGGTGCNSVKNGKIVNCDVPPDENQCYQTTTNFLNTMTSTPKSDLVSVTEEASTLTPTSRTRYYKWVFVENSTLLNWWKFQSIEKGVHTKVGTDWHWQSLTHQGTAYSGVSIGSTISLNVISAEPTLGETTAIMAINFSVTASAVCTDNTISRGWGIQTASHIFSTND